MTDIWSGQEWTWTEVKKEFLSINCRLYRKFTVLELKVYGQLKLKVNGRLKSKVKGLLKVQFNGLFEKKTILYSLYILGDYQNDRSIYDQNYRQFTTKMTIV